MPVSDEITSFVEASGTQEDNDKLQFQQEGECIIIHPFSLNIGNNVVIDGEY